MKKSFSDKAAPLKLPESVDIAIIGGGMVGASMAAMLPSHLNILLVESFPLPTSNNPDTPIYQPSYDARSSALSHSSYDIFQKMGLWPLLAQHVQPIEQVHVSDRGRWGSVLLDHKQQPFNALGYVIENAWLGRCLLHFIQQKDNIHFASPAQVDTLRPLANCAELTISSKQQDENQTQVKIQAKLAVVADGAQSKTCQKLGIYTQTTNYHHTAIVTNVSTNQAHKGIAYERFTDKGPLALLPLTVGDDSDKQHRSALIWTMPNAEAETLSALNDSDFLAALQQRFGHRQGKFTHVGERHSYPLMLSTAKEQVRRNIVILGNAAHSLHPVAGQGFNLALRDVQALCRHLEGLKTHDLGSLIALQQYAQSQEKDQLLTSIFSDALPALFANKTPLLTASRGLGLLSLALLPPLKHSFINFATGLR
jgi:2-octaprenyl-6-methoxyphenol hydroxylase